MGIESVLTDGSECIFMCFDNFLALFELDSELFVFGVKVFSVESVGFDHMVIIIRMFKYRVVFGI